MAVPYGALLTVGALLIYGLYRRGFRAPLVCLPTAETPSFSGKEIRTLVITGGIAYIQAGGGVVADSEPAAEYQETVNKAKAMMRAVEMAEKGLE